MTMRISLSVDSQVLDGEYLSMICRGLPMMNLYMTIHYQYIQQKQVLFMQSFFITQKITSPSSYDNIYSQTCP